MLTRFMEMKGGFLSYSSSAAISNKDEFARMHEEESFFFILVSDVNVSNSAF